MNIKFILCYIDVYMYTLINIR